MKKSLNEIMELASRYGLNLREETLKVNESGLDFQVIYATDSRGEQWVLRMPRREDVIPPTTKEKRVLDIIAPVVAVQVPQWTVYSNELIAYKRLSGVPAGTIDMEAKAYIWELDLENIPDHFHESLAKALVSLHQMDSQLVKDTGIKVESAQEARQSMQTRMEKVKAELGVGEALWQRWQNWLAADDLWPKQTGLVHGDLHAGHILIDENSSVTGLIDWTEAAVTDISTDFVGHYRTFGEEALEKLIMYYGQAGGYVWPKMKEHVIELTASYPVAIAEFAVKSGLEEYLQMAKESLEL